MTSILQAFDTERNQQAAFPLALIRPGRKDHPLQTSCRFEKAPKPPGPHLTLLGRIIDRRAEEQVLASSTIEADLCKLLLNRSYLDVNVPVDDAPKKVDFQKQSRRWIIRDTAILETLHLSTIIDDSRGAGSKLLGSR